MDKKLLAAAISGALAAPMTAQAVDFKTSGHINRMIRFADNGDNSDIQFTDNTSSRSRVRFVGSSDIGNGMKAGVNLEIGFASNRQFPSGSPDIQDADGGDSFEGTGDDIRHSALWFSGNWGKVHLGHTSGAADGMTGADLRGTWMGDPRTSWGGCSGCAVLSDTARGAGGRPASQGILRNYHGTFDGGRLDVLRYDSPALGPATIRISAANKGRYEVGGYVNTDVGGGALALSAGYIEATDRSNWDRWGVAGSYRFSQGTAITLQYSSQLNSGRDTGGPNPRASRDDATDFWGSIGHRWGANRVSISYGQTDDSFNNGSEGKRYGIGWQHEMSKVGVTLYAGAHLFEQEGGVRGQDTEDFTIVRLGTRVQFK